MKTVIFIAEIESGTLVFIIDYVVMVTGYDKGNVLLGVFTVIFI